MSTSMIRRPAVMAACECYVKVTENRHCFNLYGSWGDFVAE